MKKHNMSSRGSRGSLPPEVTTRRNSIDWLFWFSVALSAIWVGIWYVRILQDIGFALVGIGLIVTWPYRRHLCFGARGRHIIPIWFSVISAATLGVVSITRDIFVLLWM